MNVMLDTNICIYLMKNQPVSVRTHFDRFVPGEVGISAITLAELSFGASKSKARERSFKSLEMLLLTLEIMNFDYASAMAYGEIRAYLEKKGQPIGSLDCLIAAQALAHNLTLVTNNLREFKRVPHLHCINWV